LVKIAFELGIEYNSSVNFVYFGDKSEAIEKVEKYIQKCRKMD